MGNADPKKRSLEWNGQVLNTTWTRPAKRHGGIVGVLLKYMTNDILIDSRSRLEALIAEWGFLPFFKNSIKGFSIEELTPPDLLFGEDGEEGVWQWKGPIIAGWQCAYGKFFGRKAGFVSMEWLPDFMNWRRSAYPLRKQKTAARHILDVLRENESMLSKQLKVASGFTLSRRRTTFDPENPTKPKTNKNNGTAFDSLIADLQMGTHVCIADFEYLISAKGEPYGWGVARYCTPEAMYDIDVPTATDGRRPRQSRMRIVEHLRSLFPDASERSIDRIVGV